MQPVLSKSPATALIRAAQHRETAIKEVKCSRSTMTSSRKLFLVRCVCEQLGRSNQSFAGAAFSPAAPSTLAGDAMVTKFASQSSVSRSMCIKDSLALHSTHAALLGCLTASRRTAQPRDALAIVGYDSNNAR